MNQSSCPTNLIEKEQVLLGHGSGGELTHQLIENYFKKYFKDPLLEEAHDSVGLQINQDPDCSLVMTTDSFVVKPLFFPGGDIGKLSIIGTINDLAMSGAEPLYLSCGFILEEGLSLAILERIIKSMADEADRNGVRIVCGDTKVVERGRGDGIYINTTGIGQVKNNDKLSPKKIDGGDAIFLSGDIGRHGMSVMSEREHLSFESEIVSDCQSLWPLIKSLKENNITLHCLRDLSRGGLATALVELSETSGFNIHIDEQLISVTHSVQSACDLLGIDPFFVANEGTCILIVPKESIGSILKFTKTSLQFSGIKQIGTVDTKENTNGKGKLFLNTLYGQERRLFRLSGDQLPRIC